MNHKYGSTLPRAYRSAVSCLSLCPRRPQHPRTNGAAICGQDFFLYIYFFFFLFSLTCTLYYNQNAPVIYLAIYIFHTTKKKGKKKRPATKICPRTIRFFIPYIPLVPRFFFFFLCISPFIAFFFVLESSDP